MTREEARNRIDAIIAKHEIDDVYVTITNFKDYDALRIARKTLEQEPCEDCISRKALLEEIENGIKAGNYEEGYEEYPHINDMDDIIECIKYANSVQPKPKTGHWIDGDRTRWKCSNCGYGVLDWNNTPYCPNCGARMSESKYYAKLSKVFAQGLRHGLQDGFVESEE